MGPDGFNSGGGPPNGGPPQGGGPSHNASNDDRKVFVGGLALHTQNETLKTVFAQYGAVDTATVMTYLCPSTGEKRSRGFGFVVFEDQASVGVAVAAHRVMVDEKDCEIKKIDQTKSTMEAKQELEQRKIFCGGLHESVDGAKLKQFFLALDPNLSEARVMYDPIQKRSRCFAYVTFSAPHFVERAVANSDQNILEGKWFDVKPSVSGKGKNKGGKGKDHGKGFGGKGYANGNGMNRFGKGGQDPYGHQPMGGHMGGAPHGGMQYGGAAYGGYDPATQYAAQYANPQQQQYPQQYDQYGGAQYGGAGAVGGAQQPGAAAGYPQYPQFPQQAGSDGGYAAQQYTQQDYAQQAYGAAGDPYAQYQARATPY